MNDPPCPDAPRHLAVMPDQVIRYLAVEPGSTVVDATVGAGGHCRLLLEKLGPGGRLIGLDRDAQMLDLAQSRIRSAGPHQAELVLIHASFEDLRLLLKERNIESVDAVVADLGICSDQLDDGSRGFSFQQEGPLDMRLDLSQSETAATILNQRDERELADLFWTYGEERFSRRVAHRIVAARKQMALRTSTELADLVRRAIPRSPRSRRHFDPATRVFQALRIAVNDELGALERFLAQLADCLRPGGRAVILSFHSLEDRLVKREFRIRDRWEALTKKPVQAEPDETRHNPRARSAKLRAARKRDEPEPSTKGGTRRRQ